MKIANTFKLISRTFIGIVTLSVVLVACSKDDPEPLQVVGLKVINAFPDTMSLDFIINEQRINEKVFRYNGKMGYLDLYPGNRRLGVSKRLGNKYLASQQYPLTGGVPYSFFILDTLSTNNKKFLLIQDDLSAPATDKAKVRFVNLSKDAAALNLVIVGRDTDLFANKAFYEHTDFVAVDPGESVTFNIKEGTAVKTSLPNVKIEKGKIYTIYAKGVATATIDSLKLGAAIYTH